MKKHLADCTGLEAEATNRRRNSKSSTNNASSALSTETLAAIEAAVKRLYVDPNAEAYSIEGFCLRYGVGRQLAYDELNAGRLIGRKPENCRRTLIRRVDAERWIEGSRTYKPAGSDTAA